MASLRTLMQRYFGGGPTAEYAFYDEAADAGITAQDILDFLLNDPANEAYVLDQIANLASLEDAATPHDEIYLDTTTVPGQVLPRIRSTPRELGILAGAGLGVSSTNAETSLLTSTLAIPAGAVETGSWLEFVAWGTVLNNTGGSVNYRWRIKVGSSTIFDTTSIALASNVNGRTWMHKFRIRFTGTSGGTLTQGMGSINIGAAGGGANDDVIRTGGGVSNVVVDPQAWGAVDLTIQHNSTSASALTIANVMLVNRHKP